MNLICLYRKKYFLYFQTSHINLHYSCMTIFPKCSMKIRPNEKSTISKTVQMQCVSIFSLVSDGNIDSPSVARGLRYFSTQES